MNFFVITGIDGCGKTTQINLLSSHLSKNKHAAKVTKAYDNEAKITLRNYINSWTNSNAITFLFQALHAQQYSDTIEALNEGKIVLADRWDESYLAYHSNFGDLSLDSDLRLRLNQMAYNDLLPNLGFVLKVPVQIARERRKVRGSFGRFEGQSDEYYEILQSTYLKIAEERGWHILDGTESEENLHKSILEIVMASL